MDNFTDHESSLGSPAGGISSITPSDTVDLASATRGLNVSVGGFVRVTTVNGVAATAVAPNTAIPDLKEQDVTYFTTGEAAILAEALEWDESIGDTGIIEATS